MDRSTVVPMARSGRSARAARATALGIAWKRPSWLGTLPAAVVAAVSFLPATTTHQRHWDRGSAAPPRQLFHCRPCCADRARPMRTRHPVARARSILRWTIATAVPQAPIACYSRQRHRLQPLRQSRWWTGCRFHVRRLGSWTSTLVVDLPPQIPHRA